MMGKRFFPFFLLLLVIRANAQEPVVCQKWMNGIAGLRSGQAANDTLFQYDVKYYECFWKVDPRVRYISGSVKIFFKPTKPILRTMGLDLHDSLKVDSVLFHGKKLSFSRSPNHRVIINLSPGILNIFIDSIRVFYQGVPPKPERSFTQEYHANVPIIWTLSEPYGAKDWWPSKNALDDKADSLDVWVQTPDPNKVASNGVLVSTAKIDTNYIYHWKHRYPIETYLVAIGVTPYAEFTDYVHTSSTDSFPILNYVYREDSIFLRTPAKLTVNIMKKFIEFLGPYPFEKEKYGHAEFGFNGGMEHQTMSFMKDFNFYLVAHELGHQWFGDKVTCETWEDLWLNEGFATMCESLIAQYLAGKDEGLRVRRSIINRAHGWLTGTLPVPDTLDIGRLFNPALTYAKGGAVLNMLRFTMGDTAFFSAIRNYLNDPTLAYKTARTKDLQTHLEQVYGNSLQWFFNQWVYGEGYPLIDVHFSRKDGPLKITMSQDVTAAWSVGVFTIPVPLKVWGDGKDTMLVLQMTANKQDYELNLPYAKIDSVHADPDAWILAKFKVFDDDKNNQGPRFRVYPSPASETLTIELPDYGTDAEAQLQIIDVTGKILSEWQPKETLTPNVHQLAKGIYFVRYTVKDKVYIDRFIRGL
jgi:aminopeptidase N